MTLLLTLLLACGDADAPEPTEPTAAEATAEAEPAEADAAPEAAEPEPEPAPAKLNLNDATEDAFKALEGVGDKMAHEFVEYRPYVSIQQFRKEMSKYVDADAIAGFEAQVYVPIDFNNCDAATLMQIPGLDDANATALIDQRPFADADAFQTALKAVVPEASLPIAASYLAGQ